MRIPVSLWTRLPKAGGGLHLAARSRYIASMKILLLLLLSPLVLAAEVPAYQALGSVSIGGKGGWDYLSVDPGARRLYVSHADRVVVVDLGKDEVLHEVTGTPGVHGIAIAADLGKIFTSNGKEGKLSVVDLKSFETRAKIAVGENPDAIVYEPGHHEVYAFNGKSHSASVIDARTEKVVATLSLTGKPEFAAVDPEAHRVFVNIEDKNSLAAIDTDLHQVAAIWPLEGCESPSGLALDARNHRLFSVCENAKMVMTDSVSGKVLATVAIGQGADGVAFDQGTDLAFSANGQSGTLTIAREETPAKLVVVQDLKTEPGARTIALDPATHRVYLPTAKLLPGENGARPKPVDGTQKVLVYGP
jgi:YVTN family beta-propeller protein